VGEPRRQVQRITIAREAITRRRRFPRMFLPALRADAGHLIRASRTCRDRSVLARAVPAPTILALSGSADVRMSATAL
jgi:hypothetical protein